MELRCLKVQRDEPGPEGINDEQSVRLQPVQGIRTVRLADRRTRRQPRLKVYRANEHPADRRRPINVANESEQPSCSQVVADIMYQLSASASEHDQVAWQGEVFRVDSFPPER